MQQSSLTCGADASYFGMDTLKVVAEQPILMEAPSDCALTRPHPSACWPQVPVETLSWRLDRNITVAEGLLEAARLKEADTVVCGISGYRWGGGIGVELL